MFFILFLCYYTTHLMFLYEWYWSEPGRNWNDLLPDVKKVIFLRGFFNPELFFK
jgi:hypothetical protein